MQPTEQFMCENIEDANHNIKHSDMYNYFCAYAEVTDCLTRNHHIKMHCSMVAQTLDCK